VRHAGDGDDVDHGAAPGRRREQGEREARHLEGAVQVGVHDVPIFVAGILLGALANVGADVVDEQVEAAELSLELDERGAALRIDAHVACEAFDPSRWVCFAPGIEARREALLVARDHEDVGAELEELRRNGASDAARGAADERAPPGEREARAGRPVKDSAAGWRAAG
jgi:hypothetical protein